MTAPPLARLLQLSALTRLSQLVSNAGQRRHPLKWCAKHNFAHAALCPGIQFSVIAPF